MTTPDYPTLDHKTRWLRDAVHLNRVLRLTAQLTDQDYENTPPDDQPHQQQLLQTLIDQVHATDYIIALVGRDIAAHQEQNERSRRRERKANQ